MSLDFHEEFCSIIKQQVDRFAEWLAASWSVSESCRNDEFFRERSDDWIDGYNTALKSVPDALACWLDDAA